MYMFSLNLFSESKFSCCNQILILSLQVFCLFPSKTSLEVHPIFFHFGNSHFFGEMSGEASGSRLGQPLQSSASDPKPTSTWESTGWDGRESFESPGHLKMQRYEQKQDIFEHFHISNTHFQWNTAHLYDLYEFICFCKPVCHIVGVLKPNALSEAGGYSGWWWKKSRFHMSHVSPTPGQSLVISVSESHLQLVKVCKTRCRRANREWNAPLYILCIFCGVGDALPQAHHMTTTRLDTNNCICFAMKATKEVYSISATVCETFNGVHQYAEEPRREPVLAKLNDGRPSVWQSRPGSSTRLRIAHWMSCKKDIIDCKYQRNKSWPRLGDMMWYKYFLITIFDIFLRCIS